MNKHFRHFLLLVTIFILAESCSPTAHLYSHGNKNYAGQLSDSTFVALKQYLTNAANLTLKDTIIIRYDYNNETCWDLLDQKDDDYIMGFVTGHKKRVETILLTRQNVSVLRFREPGNNLNKIKKWDNSIIIDSTKQLFSLIFKEHCTCGSSIAIMPDKRFVFLRSDAHAEVLDLTQHQIENMLSKK